MKIDPLIEDILCKALEGRELSKEDAIRLMNVDVNSLEAYVLMAIANSATRKLFNGFGEVHAQIGINYAPCSKKCKFCAFSVADKSVELSIDEV
jgi:biotin synthase